MDFPAFKFEEDDQPTDMSNNQPQQQQQQIQEPATNILQQLNPNQQNLFSLNGINNLFLQQVNSNNSNVNATSNNNNNNNNNNKLGFNFNFSNNSDNNNIINLNSINNSLNSKNAEISDQKQSLHNIEEIENNIIDDKNEKNNENDTTNSSDSNETINEKGPQFAEKTGNVFLELNLKSINSTHNNNTNLDFTQNNNHNLMPLNSTLSGFLQQHQQQDLNNNTNNTQQQQQANLNNFIFGGSNNHNLLELHHLQNHISIPLQQQQNSQPGLFQGMSMQQQFQLLPADQQHKLIFENNNNTNNNNNNDFSFQQLQSFTQQQQNNNNSQSQHPFMLPALSLKNSKNADFQMPTYQDASVGYEQVNKILSKFQQQQKDNNNNNNIEQQQQQQQQFSQFNPLHLQQQLQGFQQKQEYIEELNQQQQQQQNQLQQQQNADSLSNNNTSDEGQLQQNNNNNQKKNKKNNKQQQQSSQQPLQKKQQSLFKNANKFFISNFLNHLSIILKNDEEGAQQTPFYQNILDIKKTGKNQRKVDLFTLVHYRLIFLKVTEKNFSQFNTQDVNLHAQVFNLSQNIINWSQEDKQRINEIKDLFCQHGKEYFNASEGSEVEQKIISKDWDQDMKDGYLKWVSRVYKKVQEMEKGDYIYRI